ncbi:hypothetical protein ACEQPO_27630 [Bacillus sp. SL00103]
MPPYHYDKIVKSIIQYGGFMMNTTFMGILGLVTMIIWIMVSTELSKSPKKEGRKRKQS